MATKAELTTGSASAATEHTEEPQLAELVTQEAGLSTEIELKVIRNDLVHYKYTYKENQVPTQKVQIVLQSKQAEQYCLGVAKLQKKRRNRAQESSRSLADWHHMEVHSHHAPKREAGLYSHFMPHRNRSAQVAGAGAATEHVFPTDASANSYNRRRIAIDADAAIRSHGHCSQSS